MPNNVGPDLKTLRYIAVSAVNDQVCDARGRLSIFITGQESTYASKLRESKALQVDDSPDLENYPYIKKQSDKTGEDVNAIANSVVSENLAYVDLDADIEAIRVWAKRAIMNASTIKEVCHHRDDAIQQLEFIREGSN